MASNKQGKVFGIVGMVSVVLWIAADLIEFPYGLQPPGNGSLLYYGDQLIFFVALVCELVMLLGLWRNKATGEGRFGKIALGIFIFGMASLVVGEIILLLTNSTHIILLPLGGFSQLLGLILTGIAVITAKRWTGWRRFAPLLQGLFFLTGLVGFFIILNQPSTFLSEVLYQFFWFLTSFALYLEATKAEQKKALVGALD